MMEENEQLQQKAVNEHCIVSAQPRKSSAEISRKRILKNLFIISFGQFLIFTAFDSLSNLQSTMNSERGVGIASQAIIYAFFTVSSLFLPTFIIKKMGCKTTLVVSVFSICPYIASNMYPMWETLIPTAAICGIAFGPFWAARSTYINGISYLYAAQVRGSLDVVNAWFFGISSFFHENAEIWGNVISYFVLKPANASDYVEESISLCGASFCDFHAYDSNPNLEPPSSERRFRLIFIYLALVALAGMIIKILLDPLPKENSISVEDKSRSHSRLFFATFKHLKNKNQLFLLSLSFYCGLADGFYNSDFTKSYIACSSGISQVGFVTISYGVTCAIMDCSSGFLVKHITRVPVFLFAALSHLAVLITCLIWTPTSSNYFVLLVLSGIYGLGSSVWWAQITAFYGVVFKNNEEAAFSNFYFWSSLGLLVAYSYSTHICTYVKIYILIVLLITSILGYLIVEKRQSNTAMRRIRESQPLSQITQIS